jgi:hypothetical protein
LPKLYLFAICSQQSGNPERAAELARHQEDRRTYKGTAQDYAPSIMPTVQVKPSEQLDTGTTVSSPPPIEAPWLKETPGQ